MVVIGSRRRNQPAPPHALRAALLDPDRDPARPWLHLLDDEHRPAVLRSPDPDRVEWSSLWAKRPDAELVFDLDPDGGSGTDLRWTLSVAEPPPDDALVGHLRRRMNQLVNGNLRSTFGR